MTTGPGEDPIPSGLDLAPGRRHYLVGLLTAVVVLLLLLVASWDDVTNERHEDGDFAANSILIDDAIALDLVHGNYSRAGFYHPGPALLGVQALSQWVLHDAVGLVPTPYNAHLVGILTLNAALLGLGSALIFRQTESLWPIALLLVFALVFSLEMGSPGLGGLLSSTWMPHVYVWPYLLLLISAAAVATGSGDGLWLLVLSGALLVHGHVSFFLPVVAFRLFATAGWILSHKSAWRRGASRPQVVAALIVLGIFLMPLIVQLFSDFPGQFDEYLVYVRTTELPYRSPADVLSYVAGYWGMSGSTVVIAPFLMVLAGIAASRIERRQARRLAVGVVFASILGTLTTLIYVQSGVDDLGLKYLALFYVAVPILILAVLAYSIVEKLRPRQPMTWLVIATALTSAVLAASAAGFGSLYSGSQVGFAYQLIDDGLGGGDPIALTLGEHSAWPHTVGLVEQSRRDGRPVCARVEPGVLRLLFTERHVCTAERGSSIELFVSTTTVGPSPGADLLFEGTVFSVWRLPRT